MRFEVRGPLAQLVRTAAYVAVAMAFFHLSRVVEKSDLWYPGLSYVIVWFCGMMSLSVLLIGAMCLLAGRPAHRLPWWFIAVVWVVTGGLLLFGLIANDYNQVQVYEKQMGKFIYDLFVKIHWDNDIAKDMRAPLEWFGFLVVFGVLLIGARLSGLRRPSEEEQDDRERREQARGAKETP
ncbi:MAG: hypothetical protein BIFFINMI_03092 [Phycisphaerae bacterium]|nr:hypothetical protein [Phycisphaerae bacterium]